MNKMTAEDFSKQVELDGIMLDKGQRLNIGFNLLKQNFVQKSSFKVSEETIMFEHENVLHLNHKNQTKLCPFCLKKANHLTRCDALNQGEFPNIIVEKAMIKLEEQESKIF